MDILGEIAAYLTDIKLDGFIYLHNISSNRFQGADRRSLRIFKKLCGPEWFKNIVLVTTFWEQTSEDLGKLREQTLLSTEDFWGWMSKKGCRVERHMNTAASAGKLIEAFAGQPVKNSEKLLEVQRDMSKNGKLVAETRAGKEAAGGFDIEKSQEAFQAELARMKAEAETGREQQRQRMMELFLQQQRDLNERLTKMEQEYAQRRTDMQRKYHEQRMFLESPKGRGLFESRRSVLDPQRSTFDMPSKVRSAWKHLRGKTIARPEKMGEERLFTDGRDAGSPTTAGANDEESRAPSNIAWPQGVVKEVLGDPLATQNSSTNKQPAFNGFLLTQPRFALTIEELRFELSSVTDSVAALAFNISLTLNEEVVIKCQPSSLSTTISSDAITATLRSIRPRVSAEVAAKHLARSVQLCALDSSLNILRREADNAASNSEWSQAVAKAAAPRMTLRQKETHNVATKSSDTQQIRVVSQKPVKDEHRGNSDSSGFAKAVAMTPGPLKDANRATDMECKRPPTGYTVQSFNATSRKQTEQERLARLRAASTLSRGTPSTPSMTKNAAPEADLDSIIYNLHHGTRSPLSGEGIRALCTKARTVLLAENTLIDVEPPVNIIGDIRGHFLALLRLLEVKGPPPQSKYVFLGNYVGFGDQSVLTICLLLAYKCKFPESIYLLRGMHETGRLGFSNGFMAECQSAYGTDAYKKLTAVFNCLPIGALVGGKLFAVSGGLSPYLHTLDAIRSIRRPTNISFATGLLSDLVSTDPDESKHGWSRSSRGSWDFGTDVALSFCRTNHIKLIVRGHQLVREGHRFSHSNKVLTLWSARGYKKEFDNSGAFLDVSEDLTYTVRVSARHGADIQTPYTEDT